MEFWNGVLIGFLSGIILAVACAVMIGLRARNMRARIPDTWPPSNHNAGGTPGIARAKVRMEETACAVLNPERPNERAHIEKG